MAISDALLPEFDHEMAQTRKTIERIPAERFDWVPHEKSMNFGDLATHVVHLPGWTPATLNSDNLEVGSLPQPSRVMSTEDALSTFDAKVAEGRAAIAACTDETWMSPWSLVMNGQTQFTMPKVAVVRGFILNHLIHHRAQLGLYLRLNDVPVPSIYGPSADEQG